MHLFKICLFQYAHPGLTHMVLWYLDFYISIYTNFIKDAVIVKMNKNFSNVQKRPLLLRICKSKRLSSFSLEIVYYKWVYLDKTVNSI